MVVEAGQAGTSGAWIGEGVLRAAVDIELLLIVGGNDTTRNSISGGVIALNRYPDQYQKLRDNPALYPTWFPQ